MTKPQEKLWKDTTTGKTFKNFTSSKKKETLPPPGLSPCASKFGLKERLFLRRGKKIIKQAEQPNRDEEEPQEAKARFPNYDWKNKKVLSTITI